LGLGGHGKKVNVIAAIQFDVLNSYFGALDHWRVQFWSN